MMLPPRAVIPALLAAAFIMMLSGQLWMKVTKLSRTSRGLRDASGRISKTLAFVTSMCRYDLEVIRRCRRCMVRLASARIREVALFGAGDVARVLRLQALAAGVDVVAVYADVDAEEPVREKFFGHCVQPAAACRLRDHKIVVAALVGVEDQLEVLHRVGVRVDDIIQIA